jgi:hypothetical protein
MNSGRFDAVLIAGDEPPNSRAFLRSANGKDTPTAEDFARRFSQTDTPIHTFVIGDDYRAVQAFEMIASLSGGKSGKLDGSADMIHMAVMAMLAKLKGGEGVNAYMRDYHVKSKAADFGKLLLGAPKK